MVNHVLKLAKNQKTIKHLNFPKKQMLLIVCTWRIYIISRWKVEKAYKRLSDAFGDISDIDNNGAVDLFLSPEINRSHFSGVPSDDIDSFKATLPYRPNDLAPFDAHRNSTSNEAEVLYLWVPDPAGIYTYGYPTSSNSLTSNYSKGYLAAQLMNLIILNHKTIVENRLQNEERWIMEVLSLLASSYIGGNNYVF